MATAHSTYSEAGFALVNDLTDMLATKFLSLHDLVGDQQLMTVESAMSSVPVIMQANAVRDRVEHRDWLTPLGWTAINKTLKRQ